MAQMNLVKLIEKYWYLVIICTVLAVYGKTFLNQWTYDDLYVVVNNSDTFSLSEFMKDSYPGRPLRELTHIIERSFFGTKPAGYHVLQLLLHILNGIILCTFMVRAGLSRLSALLGALFFLLHPFQSESVANIGHRKELLGFFGALLSMIFYQQIFHSKDNKRHLFMILAMLLFGLGMAGNLTIITLPVIWIGYEYFLIPTDKRYLLKFPKALTAASLSAFATLLIWLYPFLSTQRLLAVYLKNNYTASQNLLPHIMGVFSSFALYCQKLLYPIHLAPEYVIPLANTYTQPLAWCGIVVLILSSVLMYLYRSSAPLPVFGIYFFLTLYLPISNIVPAGYSMADRYMYVPLAGLAIVFAHFAERTRFNRLIYLAIIYLILLSAFTFVQNKYWLNEFVLWEHAVTVNPQSSPAQEAAAHAAMLNGKLQLAHTHALEAVKLKGSDVRSYFTLAMIEEIMGDTTSAVTNYSLFIKYGNKINPDLARLARQKIEAIAGK